MCAGSHRTGIELSASRKALTDPRCKGLRCGRIAARRFAPTCNISYVRTPQMNSADSERMAGVLEAAGYACSTEAGEADVLIYNTCSIREKAEQKVYSALGKQVG